jgi:hypothetical protein
MLENIIRKSLHSIEEVFLQAQSNKKTFQKFAGNRIVLNSHRIKNFQYHGINCVECGLQALYFAKERHKKDKKYHLSLYGIIGVDEILFTQDHIKPRSRGGRNCIHNLQPMCESCNILKSDEWGIRQRWILFKTWASHWVRHDRFSCSCRWIDITVDILT